MATLPNSASNLIPIKVTQLMDAPVASEDGLILYIYNGNTYKIRVGDLLQVSGVPLSRNVLAGTGLTGGGPLSADVTLSVAPGGIGTTQLAATGVTPGQYGSASLVPVVTLDSTGRITSITTTAVDSSGGVPPTRQVIAGTGLSGGGVLSADVTLTANLSSATPLALDGAGVAGVSAWSARGDHQHPAIDLADDTQVDGLLGLDHGGTAKSIVPAAGALVWSGADGLYVGTAGVNGQVPVSGGSGQYTWGNVVVQTDQDANLVYASPASGPAGPTGFRALVVADVPTLNQNTTGTASNVTGIVAIANGGTGQTDKTAAFDALSPVLLQGDLIVGGALGTNTRLAVGPSNTLLHGGASPAYSAVVEADITLSANTTNDVTPARHGFCPVLPNNANLFLNGQGNYTLPSGLTISASYSATAFSGQTSVNVIHNFGTYPLVQVIDNTGAVLIPLSTVNNTLNDFTVTFAVSTTGTIMASVGSPQPQALTSTSNDYTVLITDRIVKVTGSGKIITLPTAVGNTGREFIINNASPGNVFVNTTSAQLISGQLDQLLPSYSSMTVYSDGSAYWII